MNPFDALGLSQRFAALPAGLHHAVDPDPVPDPVLLHFNRTAAQLVGLDPDAGQHELAAQYLSGNRLLPGSQPLASLYAGHQFGYFVSRLGDGRALLLGDVPGTGGERWELQLKGSGRTPYSRGGDGRAVLRSSLREYLCSEAMAGLGVPTTRALSLVGSPLPVWRETQETAAIVLRMSPSFMRFGHFEAMYAHKQPDALRELADFMLRHHFPHWIDLPDRYERLLAETTRRTATLLAHWQAVGFTHGVMNTDNMSLLGLTLDYGPFGFMDDYDPGFVCNHSDETGRYAFDQQPDVAGWNLTRLAQALSPLISEEAGIAAISDYPARFASTYIQLMSARLGLPAQREHARLILSMLELLHANRVDYTIFLRRLCHFDSTPAAPNAPLRDLFIDRAAFDAWADDYRAALRQAAPDDAQRARAMLRVNPKYILRNHLAEQVIEAVRDRGDMAMLNAMVGVLQAPFDEHPQYEHWAEPPPPGNQVMLSCSS